MTTMYCDEQTKKEDYAEIVESKKFLNHIIKRKQLHLFNSKLCDPLDAIIESAKEWHKKLYENYMENYK